VGAWDVERRTIVRRRARRGRAVGEVTADRLLEPRRRHERLRREDDARAVAGRHRRIVGALGEP